jgi:hypothetical protein
MARKFQNVSGRDQVFTIWDEKRSAGQYWAPERTTVTVPENGIVEGDHWEKYVGPSGPLKEVDS